MLDHFELWFCIVGFLVFLPVVVWPKQTIGNLLQSDFLHRESEVTKSELLMYRVLAAVIVLGVAYQIYLNL